MIFMNIYFIFLNLKKKKVIKLWIIVKNDNDDGGG